MNAIRIQNLRSLVDTDFIELKPLTLLVGENSSGKSTFLRAFPLLKQSVKSRTRGPILWNDQVDFGSFEEALSKQATKDEIVFQFRFQFPKNQQRYILGKLEFLLAGLELTVALHLAKGRDGWTQTHACTLSFADHTVKIIFGKEDKVETFRVNDRSFEINNLYRIPESNRILPYLVTDNPRSDEMRKLFSARDLFFLDLRNNLFLNLLIKEVRDRVHKNTSQQTILEFIANLKIGSSEQMLADMKKKPMAVNTWRNRVANWSMEHEDFLYLRDLIIANHTGLLLQVSDAYLSSFASNVSYIAPVRAYPNRDYRLQDFAIDEVDFDGRNLPMFLHNLTAQEKKSFSRWTQRLLGFSTEIQAIGSRISIHLIQDNSSEKFNLMDTGFGFSQMLPIVAQLWALVNQPGRRRNRAEVIIFAIEQPELHLHPRLQAKLLDAFWLAVQEGQERELNISLLLETHSPTIVNRLGHQIANGRIKSEDVNVVLFEKAGVHEPTKVRVSTFDGEGFLQNWPLGFFLPDEVT